MRKYITILLLLVLHTKPVANGIIVFDFLLNQEYIKEFLCINKEKPELQCNGKCYLMQQLKETEKESKDTFPELHSEKIEYVSLENIDIQEKEIKYQDILKENYHHYLYYSTKDIVLALLDPPEIV